MDLVKATIIIVPIVVALGALYWFVVDKLGLDWIGFAKRIARKFSEKMPKKATNENPR